MNLSVMKSVFPNFELADFTMFDKIISLKWETVFDSESWEEYKILTLEMVSTDNCKILMEFIGVDLFRFEGDGRLSGFYVKDMFVRGYENAARYEAGDYEEDELRFYCSDVIIKSLEKPER